MDSPWAAAIAKFKATHHIEGGKWVPHEFNEEERNLLRQLAAGVSSLFKFAMKGDGAMDNAGEQAINGAAFAELQGKFARLEELVTALSQERDTLRAQVQAGEQKLQTEVYAWQLVEMKAHVQKYGRLALPVELAQDAPAGSLTSQEHFAWLYNTDSTPEKKRWAFFNAVFAAMDKALAEAEVFSELGHSAETDPDILLHQKAQAYASRHKVDYITALKAVIAGAEPAQAA